MTVDRELGHDEALHTDWDNAREPALTVPPGTTVRFDCLNDSGPRITPETRSADLPEQEFVGHHLTGPVAVEGGLFSIGDGHAAQGDGEVCVSAIETPTEITARLTLREDLDIERPQFETAGPFRPSGLDAPAYATTGIRDDLMAASRDAVRAMIDRLHERRGLSREEAYVLCSVAADLKINEVVDAPNWVVSAYLSEGIFPEEGNG